MSANKLINHIAGLDEVEISNIVEQKGELIFLEMQVKDEKNITKFMYFEKRVKELDESIKTELTEEGLLSFFFTKRKPENYENLLKAFLKKYYLIEEPEKEDFTIIAKITARCNLSCAYCYDQEFRAALSHCGNLPLEDLDKVCRMAAAHAKRVQLILHGGEPSLAGIPYIRSVIRDIVPKYPYCQFDVCMQSNGLVFDEEWKSFFKETGLGIGISYSALDPSLRFLKGQEEKVLANIKMLVEAGICSGIIDVITNTTIEGVEKIYNFYKANNLPQNLNLVYDAPNLEGEVIFKTSDADKYYEVVKKYFKKWICEQDAKTERFASMYIENLLSATGGTCNHHGTCINGLWMGVNANGDIYPCDSDYPKQYRMANVSEIESLAELYGGAPWQSYYKERKEAMAKCKEKCRLYPYCKGGCPANDVMSTGSAGKKNPHHCSIFHKTMLAAYEALKSVTIDTINPMLREHILRNNCILPGEINSLLRELGIGKNELCFEDKETLFDKNFELFQTFNHPYTELRIQGPANDMGSCSDAPPEKDERFKIIKEALREKDILKDFDENYTG